MDPRRLRRCDQKCEGLRSQTASREPHGAGTNYITTSAVGGMGIVLAGGLAAAGAAGSPQLLKDW